MTSACKGDEFWHLMGRGNDSSDSLAASYCRTRGCLGVQEDEDVM